MQKSSSTSAQQICERILRAGQSSRISKDIFRSEVAVASKLLHRGLELSNAYQDLHTNLGGSEQAIDCFLDVVLNTAAFWNPDAINQFRSDRAELRDVNQKISKIAAELSDLLEKREELHNNSGFTDGSHYHICDIIDAANRGNGLYSSYLKTPLMALHSQFDLKYWPSTQNILQVIAEDAASVDVVAGDEWTAVATDGSRASLADFFKVLFQAIRDNSRNAYGPLPNGLKLKDESIASFANCALGLQDDEMVDGAYVKTFRSRFLVKTPMCKPL